MTSKKVLFSGILLLIIGIVVRKTTDLNLYGLLMILLGVGLKTMYIIGMAKEGLYKPGKELWLLFIGLGLLFVSIYSRGQEALVAYSGVLLASAIAFKVLFIIGFIKKVKSERQKLQA